MISRNVFTTFTLRAMTLKRAQQVLENYNAWRRHEGKPVSCPHSGMEIGTALDVAINALWRLKKIQGIVYFGEGYEHLSDD